jgi:hypothetical protein
VSRPDDDPVARYIAAIVHRLATSPGLPPPPEGVAAVECHPVGVLDLGVAVTMADQRVRYYLVRVREYDTR